MNASDYYQDTAARIEKALRYCDDTQAVVVGEQTLGQVGTFFKRLFPNQRAIVVADATTFELAGKRVAEELNASGISTDEPYVYNEPGMHAEMRLVDMLKPRLAATDAIPVAVGSGTVNDLCKYSSSLVERSYMVVGTAASMDGYASFGASIEYNECKQTFSCPAPRGILIDMDVVCKAPVKMNAAGFADLIAKIPAGADWILADLIGTEPIDSIAWSLVQDSLRDWVANPEGVASGDRKALTFLTEGLIMSGLAMQKAKTSRTASGAEHQFSHLWDNQHHKFNGEAPSHGFKVGVGTVSTSALYERILSTWNESTFDAAIATIPQNYRTWETIEKELEENFGTSGLYETVKRECAKKFVEPDELERRLKLFRDNWNELKERLSKQLMSAAEIQGIIAAAKAPSTPEEIGIERSRLQKSYALAQQLRYRYNCLDWVRDLELWEQTVTPLFQPNGFWFK
ncbi:MAG: sn-glycerol-1-phosphate dehydrogenase [Thermoguttaceae bacterium]|nr:sn-glycerol-1-phosphate dehydrogenase [Thermoguttaceae bacterium]